jgi:uncharacterized repeat protein (TIGR01451 family)
MRAALSLVLLLGGLPTLLTAQSVSFDIATAYTLPLQSRSVAVADFNGDGFPDLAVSHDAGVSVLLGSAAGAFGPEVTYAAGQSPRGLAVADLNGDSLPDLAVTNLASNDVSILLGTGTGTFGVATQYPVDAGPTSIAVGSFNADSLPDLVVGNRNSFVVSVLLGSGGGTFAPAVNNPVGGYVTSVAVADLDGDSFQDLVVATWDDSVRTLAGTGTGMFGPAVAHSLGLGFQAASVAVADLDADGLPDLAVANEFTDNVSILLGTGAGNFAPATSYPAGYFPSGIAAGDLDGDGALDLVVGNAWSSDVSVLRGTGGGVFATARSFGAGSGPGLLAGVGIADLDGDTHPDLAVASGYSVSVFRGTGTGDFHGPRTYEAGQSPTSVAIGDFNGDTVPDLGVANADSNDVSTFLGLGGGSFGPGTQYPAAPFPFSVASGDFNGDGFSDLATAGFNFSSLVSVLLATGTGSFQPQGSYPVGDDPRSLAVADVDGDGFQDLVVANSDSNYVVILHGSGPGALHPEVVFLPDDAESVAVGDLNEDTLPDLVVAHGFAHSVSVVLGSPGGGFQLPSTFPVAGNPQWIALGDFNGDTHLDVAVTGDTGGGHVSILLGTGTGGLGAATPYAVAGGPGAIAVADLNGDSFLDAAVLAYSDLAVLLGTGTGSLLPAVRIPLGRTPAGLAIADLDGDAQPDVAIADFDGQRLWVLLNKSQPLNTDVAIAVDDGQAVAIPGGPISYAITVTNNGPDELSSVRVVDSVPPEILGPTFVPSVGSYDSSTGLWSGLGLPAAQSATLTMSGTVSPMAAGTLTNTVTASMTPGHVDGNPSNDVASDTDTVTPAADLAVTKAGSAVPVQPGSNFTYSITVTNNGPVDASGVTVTDVLPPAVTFASSTSCTEAGGTVTCGLGSLAASASALLTFDVTANPGYSAAINTVSATATELDPVASNNTATDVTILDLGIGLQLTHGSSWVRDLAALPGPTPHRDLFRLTQEPRSSWEIVVDSLTGDLATPTSPIRLQRLDVDLVSVLQDALPLGSGFSRSLRFQNPTANPVSYQIIGVSSGGCSTDCDVADTYRIRAWDTTASVPRFNNTGSQVTVLVLENVAPDAVTGTVWFWDVAGIPIASQPFSIAPRGVLVFDTTAAAPGGQGSLTLSHDGRHAQLQGKAVAVEPATGLTFETELQTRPR